MSAETYLDISNARIVINHKQIMVVLMGKQNDNFGRV